MLPEPELTTPAPVLLDAAHNSLLCHNVAYVTFSCGRQREPGTYGLGAVIPAGSIVGWSWYKVRQSFLDPGEMVAAISMGIETVDDLAVMATIGPSRSANPLAKRKLESRLEEHVARPKNAKDVRDAKDMASTATPNKLGPWQAGMHATLVSEPPSFIETTGDREITITVHNAPLVTGRMFLYLEFIFLPTGYVGVEVVPGEQQQVEEEDEEGDK